MMINCKLLRLLVRARSIDGVTGYLNGLFLVGIIKQNV